MSAPACGPDRLLEGQKKHDHGTVGKEKPPDVDTRSGDVDLNVAMTTL